MGWVLWDVQDLFLTYSWFGHQSVMSCGSLMPPVPSIRSEAKAVSDFGAGVLMRQVRAIVLCRQVRCTLDW
jgi:hypothetical protein